MKNNLYDDRCSVEQDKCVVREIVVFDPNNSEKAMVLLFTKTDYREHNWRK